MYGFKFIVSSSFPTNFFILCLVDSLLLVFCFLYIRFWKKSWIGSFDRNVFFRWWCSAQTVPLQHQMLRDHLVSHLRLLMRWLLYTEQQIACMVTLLLQVFGCCLHSVFIMIWLVCVTCYSESEFVPCDTPGRVHKLKQWNQINEPPFKCNVCLLKMVVKCVWFVSVRC